VSLSEVLQWTVPSFLFLLVAAVSFFVGRSWYKSAKAKEAVKAAGKAKTMDASGAVIAPKQTFPRVHYDTPMSPAEQAEYDAAVQSTMDNPHIGEDYKRALVNAGIAKTPNGAGQSTEKEIHVSLLQDIKNEYKVVKGAFAKIKNAAGEVILNLENEARIAKADIEKLPEEIKAKIITILEEVQETLIVEIGNLTKVEVTGLSVSPLTVSGKAGDTATPSVTVNPPDATDKTLSFSSTNPTVATVDENGVITLVAPGSAAVIVKTNDGGFSTSVTVIVSAAQ
jgi:hypothetical protein